MINHHWSGTVWWIFWLLTIRNRSQIWTWSRLGVMVTVCVAQMTCAVNLKFHQTPLTEAETVTRLFGMWKWLLGIVSGRYKALHATLHCLYHSVPFCGSLNGHYCCQVKAPCMRSAMDSMGVRYARLLAGRSTVVWSSPLFKPISRLPLSHMSLSRNSQDLLTFH